MKEVKGKLVESIERTEAVESFRFVSAENIDFLPGQFLQLIFDKKDRSNKDLNKYLSFSCAPGKGYIEVTKKLSDSKFSQSLRELQQGDTVLFKAPMGNHVFKEEYKKIGFLVGGIGITPVISILEYITDKSIPTDVCLLYSNWTKNDIAFKKELDAWGANSKNIKVIHTLVSCDRNDKEYFEGMIDKELIEKQICDLYDRVVFIFGPPGMVDAMKSICNDLGISKDMLKAESFVGY